MDEHGDRVRAHCPHCGHTSPQELRGEFSHINQHQDETSWAFLECLTCGEGLLYRSYGRPGSTRNRHWWNFEPYRLIYPQPSTLHDAVPERIKDIYSEAARIKGVGVPNAFANSIRRALEALCKDQNAWKKTLQKSLEELQARKVLPDNLVGMSDILRELGNDGSHDDERPVRPEYVEPMDEFFRAIVEYVYVAPFKVEEFKRTLTAATQATQSPPPPTPAPVAAEIPTYDDDIPF